MILVVDDDLWKEYRKALSALDRRDVQRPHSHYGTSLERTEAIHRLVLAKAALLAGLRVPTTADRAALLAALDATRARPAIHGPKPPLNDPLTER